MKALNDGEYNVGVFLIPGPQNPDDPDEVIFLSAPAETDATAGDIENLEELLPDNWDGKVVPHLWDIEKVITDMERSPNFGIATDARAKYAEEGVSHVAILESPVINPDSHPFKLGSQLIKGNSLMVMYSADRNKYRLFHCTTCGVTFAKWLEEKQPEWWDASSGFQSEAKALH